LAYLSLAEQMDRPEIVGEAFNFSNERQIPVIEIVRKILALMGRTDLKPEVKNEAAGEIKHQYLSAAKARKLLGWKPKFTLEEGLKRAIAWYESYFKEEKKTAVGAAR